MSSDSNTSKQTLLTSRQPLRVPTQGDEIKTELSTSEEAEGQPLQTPCHQGPSYSKQLVVDLPGCDSLQQTKDEEIDEKNKETHMETPTSNRNETETNQDEAKDEPSESTSASVFSKYKKTLLLKSRKKKSKSQLLPTTAQQGKRTELEMIFKIPNTPGAMESRWKQTEQMQQSTTLMARVIGIQTEVEKSLANELSKVEYRPLDAYKKTTFSLAKQGITRIVRLFTSEPESRPKTVVFEFPSYALTHNHVITMTQAVLIQVLGAKVTEIQFVDMNVLHGSRGLESRWLITVNTFEARDRLIRCGFLLFKKTIKIRTYDAVTAEEYANFLKYKKHLESLNIKAQQTSEELAEIKRTS